MHVDSISPSSLKKCCGRKASIVLLHFSPPCQTKYRCQAGQEEGCDIKYYILLKVR